MTKKSDSFSYLRTVGILLLCIILNCAGRELGHAISAPGWLDSYGTFLAAYAMGPIPGCIVGVSSNIIYSFWDPYCAYYAVVSIFIGIVVGVLSRKRYFDSIFHTMTVAGSVASGCLVISTVINFFLYSGMTNNMWGDGVIDLLRENGVNKYLSALIGEFYIEFFDKLVTAMLMFLTVMVIRKLRNKRAKKAAKQATAAAAAIAVMLTVGAQYEPMTASAENPTSHISYIQTIYNGSNGLLSGHANAIAQTNEGVLWIGTYAGLYRYNGHEFVYRSDLEDIKNVNCLYVDNEGRLWIGTNDNGVVIVINEKVANVINSKNGLPSDTIRSIVQSSSGEYYIGTSSGIVTMEMKIGMSVSAEVQGVGFVDRLSADNNGNVAAVNKDGQLFVLKAGKVTKTIENAYGGRTFSTCAFDKQGSLYTGTTDGMVSRYIVKDNDYKNWDNTTCSGMTKINNIYPDQDGLTWVCSDSGIGYINSSNLFSKQESGDFDHAIEKMLTDYQGNLWFASSRLGLLRLSRSSVKDIYADTGLKPSVVNTTAIRGSLLYSGADDGLRIIDTTSHTLFKNDLTRLLDGQRIRCMMSDSEQAIWICSYGKGLVCYDRFGKITEYSSNISEIGDRVRVCLEMSDGTIAVSSSN
ncbi:MAG: hypothetical protein II574_04970, partial [Ruminococcus sp.]|nr:hypothetical protein [Ruminococcus sp.]